MEITFAQVPAKQQTPLPKRQSLEGLEGPERLPAPPAVDTETLRQIIARLGEL